MKNKTLIYLCCFFSEGYLDLCTLAFRSLALYGDCDPDEFDILTFTSPEFEARINDVYNTLGISGKTYCIEVQTIFDAGCARLHVFDYPGISDYEKILYLDCDILITAPITKITKLDITSKLYALEEGTTEHRFWGKDLFSKENNPRTRAFTTGILLFRNCIEIKQLFDNTLAHISSHLDQNLPIPTCLDQPFIIYQFMLAGAYDNQRLKRLVVNNPRVFRGEAISHFPGWIGDSELKIDKMKRYMNYMLRCSDQNIIPPEELSSFTKPILEQKFTLVSEKRLVNVYRQCEKFSDTSYSFVECGVGKGGCCAMMKLAAGKNNHVYGFDSFEGMPQIGDNDLGMHNLIDPNQFVGYNVSEGVESVFRTFEVLELNLKNVSIIEGFFEDTFPENVSKIKDIAVLRLDSDWYASTKYCLETLYSKVVDGGVVIIDDYGTFHGCREATDEFRLKNEIDSPLIKTDHTEYYWIKSDPAVVKYLQVGSHVGNTSNDQVFNNVSEKDQCIFIEPVPYLFQKLVKNYSEKHPGNSFKFLNHAVSNVDGMISLYVPSENNDFSKMPAWASQLASVNQGHIETFVPDCKVELHKVEAKTLNKILIENNIREVENLHIDTEGHDFEILMELDLTILKPKNIVFENKHMDGPSHQLDPSNAPRYMELLRRFEYEGYSIAKQSGEDTHLKLTNDHSVDIYDDVWTCSRKFRSDISRFFYDRNPGSITELGSHKGYTTEYLSRIFGDVVAVDNQKELLEMNQRRNALRKNIQYFELDIYKQSWSALPAISNVVFIDAFHDYESCKSDIVNSIQHFPNLEFIVLDDYGVWPGVKQVVTEFQRSGIFKIVRRIGITDVPGLRNEITKETSEGVIVQIDATLIGRQFTWKHDCKKVDGCIEFKLSGLSTTWSKGSFSILSNNTVLADWGNTQHVLKFDQKFERFISVRKGDLNLSCGELI